MTEASGTKINAILCWDIQSFSNRGWSRKTHHKILKQAILPLQCNVQAACQVCCLLQEDGILAEYFTHVDFDFLDTTV